MNERLIQYMALKGVSRKEMAQIIQMTYNAFNKVIHENRSFSSEYVERILLHFPDLDARWLITGVGISEGSIPIYKVTSELLDDQNVREKLAEIIAKKLQTSQ